MSLNMTWIKKWNIFSNLIYHPFFRVAESVKYAKDSARSSVLKTELGRVAAKVQNHSFRLPTNASLLCSGLNVEVYCNLPMMCWSSKNSNDPLMHLWSYHCQESSYFASNAIPLKLSFINKESVPKHIDLMYKVGSLSRLNFWALLASG